MSHSVKENLMNDENSHYDLYKKGRFVDIHCHCLPGLDDGPRTTKESLELCKMLASESVTTVVATPHQLGRFDVCNKTEHVRQAVHDLTALLKKKDIPLEIVPGAEVRVDERICRFLKADRILTLADGGKYLLLELPNEVFIDVIPLLVELSSIGIDSIIAHAERIIAMKVKSSVLLRWLNHSAHLQINASSLLGDFGPDLQRTAWELLTSGWATLVATDAHDVDLRRPRMKAAFESIRENLSEDLAYLVCIDNPYRVLHGEDVIPVSVQDQQKVTR